MNIDLFGPVYMINAYKKKLITVNRQVTQENNNNYIRQIDTITDQYPGRNCSINS